MLVFSQIVHDTNYEGTVYIWLMGIPFIFLVVKMRREYRYDALMVNSNNFESLNQSIFQIFYLTRMLNYYDKDRNVAAILEACIYYHRTFCRRLDCPSNPKMSTKKIKKFIKSI